MKPKLMVAVTCGETKKAMEAYKQGEIFKSIVENPDFKNVTSKEFCVHAKASEIQKNLKN